MIPRCAVARRLLSNIQLIQRTVGAPMARPHSDTQPPSWPASLRPRRHTPTLSGGCSLLSRTHTLYASTTRLARPQPAQLAFIWGSNLTPTPTQTPTPSCARRTPNGHPPVPALSALPSHSPIFTSPLLSVGPASALQLLRPPKLKHPNFEQNVSFPGQSPRRVCPRGRCGAAEWRSDVPASGAAA